MQPSPINPVGPPLVGRAVPLKELAALLVKHFDLHEGLYDAAITLQIGVGAMGPPNAQMPGASIAVTAVGLAKTNVAGANTVDAAIVNPGGSTTSAKTV